MTESLLKLPLRVTGDCYIWDAHGHTMAESKGIATADKHARLRELVHRCNNFDALLAACKTALKVVSEIADIDSESRAGWAHKELDAAIESAEKRPKTKRPAADHRRLAPCVFGG